MNKKSLKFKERITNTLNKLMKKDVNGHLLEPVKKINPTTYLIFDEIETNKKGLSEFAKILNNILNK